MKVKEICVCSKCFKEYTREEAVEVPITENSSDVVCPFCKEPGYYLILEDTTGTRFIQEELVEILQKRKELKV